MLFINPTKERNFNLEPRGQSIYERKKRVKEDIEENSEKTTSY